MSKKSKTEQRKDLEEALQNPQEQTKFEKIKSWIWTMIMPIIAAIITVVGIICFFIDFNENIKTLMGLSPLFGLALVASVWGVIDFVKNKRKHKNEENTRI